MRFPERHKLPEIDDYLELDFNHFKIFGRSIAGIETVYSIPQWDITFDTGRAPHFAFANNYLALSHWHLDHAGGLAFYLGLRCLNALEPLKIIVPHSKVKSAENFLKELKKVSETNIQYKVLSAKDPIAIKKDIQLMSIPCFHSTEATGYLVIEKKHQLKDKFKGLSQEEIINAKKSGQEVNEEIQTNIFAYSGDTKCEFFETEAVRAKILLMECSFFSEDSNYEKIRAYGHTHIQDWVRYAHRIESDTVIMTHTSQRYTKEEIVKYCQKYLPKSLTDRLIIFR